MHAARELLGDKGVYPLAKGYRIEVEVAMILADRTEVQCLASSVWIAVQFKSWMMHCNCSLMNVSYDH